MEKMPSTPCWPDKLGPSFANYVLVLSRIGYFPTTPSIPIPPHANIHYLLLSFALQFVSSSIVVRLFSHVRQGNSGPVIQHGVKKIKREKRTADQGRGRQH